jgi:hypothetical protein
VVEQKIFGLTFRPPPQENAAPPKLQRMPPRVVMPPVSELVLAPVVRVGLRSGVGSVRPVSGILGLSMG